MPGQGGLDSGSQSRYWRPRCSPAAEGARGAGSRRRIEPHAIRRSMSGTIIALMTASGSSTRADPVAGSAVYPLRSRVNDAGRLEVGGCDVVAVAREFGTPAYVYAEDDVRVRARA